MFGYTLSIAESSRRSRPILTKFRVVFHCRSRRCPTAVQLPGRTAGAYRGTQSCAPNSYPGPGTSPPAGPRSSAVSQRTLLMSACLGKIFPRESFQNAPSWRPRGHGDVVRASRWRQLWRAVFNDGTLTRPSLWKSRLSTSGR